MFAGRFTGRRLYDQQFQQHSQLCASRKCPGHGRRNQKSRDLSDDRENGGEKRARITLQRRRRLACRVAAAPNGVARVHPLDAGFGAAVFGHCRDGGGWCPRGDSNLRTKETLSHESDADLVEG